MNSANKVRTGGIVAFITSKGTLDKENPSVRKYLAQRADLIGAIRLPNNTFKANAGTEVTSNIIFLQKRDRVIDVDPFWLYRANDKIEMKKPFPQENELVEKTKRLDELNILLNMDEKNNEVFDGDIDNNDIQKSSKDKDDVR